MPRLKGSADLLEDRRKRALALLDSGESLNEVGRRIGCNPRGDRRAAAPARQIGQGLPHPQIQGLAYAPFHSWPVRRQAPGDFRNRLSGVIAQQNRGPLHAARRLASRQRERGEHFRLLGA